MNRERAEAFLRQLAEAELRRAATQADGRGLLDECHSVRLEVTAQALHAVRAFDMAAANEIQAELAFALGVGQPGPGPGGLAPNAQAQENRLSHVPPGPGAGQHWPPAPPGPWRVVPASQVIRHPDGDIAGELHLQAYIRTPIRACFTGISYWGPGQERNRHMSPPGVLLADRSTVVDDQGTGYQLRSSLGGGWPGHEWSGALDLYPTPPPDIRWLDLSTAPGEPATRIDLDIQPAQPHMTMTPATVSPGELLLTDIAAGFLALASPEQVPLHPSAARADPLSEAPVGLADIVAALQACGALPARVAVLGLHNGERGQFLHLLTSGVTPEYTWHYGVLADRMPVLWLRGRGGRWHTARPVRSAPLRETDDYMLWLRVVPPLDYGTADVDVMVTGPTAQVQVRLPLSWNGLP